MTFMDTVAVAATVIAMVTAMVIAMVTVGVPGVSGMELWERAESGRGEGLHIGGSECGD